MSPETIRDKAAALLVELGVGEDCVISPLPGSRTQRTFHCRHRGNELVIKGYPTLEAHGIDPFAAECAFYDYLESIRPEQTPQARGWDGEQRVGVLSLWPGRPPRPVELGTEFVRAAGRFIAIINHRRHELPSAFPSLPQREESISALLQSINQTLIEGLPEALLAIEPLKLFWEEDLQPAWHQVMGTTLSGLHLANLDSSQRLEKTMALITPGDLGPENALIGPDRRYGFCDFDQVSWTDPGYLIARFFCRLGAQETTNLLPQFMEALEGIPHLDPHTAIRSRLLLPAMHMEQALLELFGFESWGCMEHQVAAADATHRVAWMERLGIARKRIKKVLMHLPQP